MEVEAIKESLDKVEENMAENWRKQSNLQSFLAHTTPCVPVFTLPKTCIRDINALWQMDGKEKVEYFTLGDLWNQYTEWSVFGAAVPVVLNSCEVVKQYYVPYLSAIQIYTSKYLAFSRTMLEESESESFSDDSGSEKLSKSWDTVSEESALDHDNSLSTKDHLGQLYFQYIEYGSPYGRVPLVDKVNELAQYFPGLKSFKSVEISPASWMSVAWYPICQIPSHSNVKDSSASFLTYHTLSALFQDNNLPEDLVKDSPWSLIEKNGWMQKTRSNCIPLSPFGLATYTLHGFLWRKPETKDQELLDLLLGAAYSWLKQLRVEHHDFDFFMTH